MFVYCRYSAIVDQDFWLLFPVLILVRSVCHLGQWMFPHYISCGFREDVMQVYWFRFFYM